MLEIEFKDGSVYRYRGVDKKDFKALMHADSKGKHFHQHIKGQYLYKKYRDQEGSKTEERYHMKTATIQNFDEFVKVADWVYRDGKVLDPKYYGIWRESFVQPVVKQESGHRPPKGAWEPAKPLTKSQKAYMGTALAIGGALSAADIVHRMAKRRALKKKEKELREAGWIPDTK